MPSSSIAFKFLTHINYRTKTHSYACKHSHITTYKHSLAFSVVLPWNTYSKELSRQSTELQSDEC
jgi:hypothetical protein